MKKIIVGISIILCSLYVTSCDTERTLIPNTHDTKVPEVVSLISTVDTTLSRKKVVTLKWTYDTVRYGKNDIAANLKNWEIFKTLDDTSNFVSKGTIVFSLTPVWKDTSNDIQPTQRDSIIVFYKLLPTGFSKDRIQFTGKPSDVLRIIVRKKI
jgi:hypothetical protein